MVCATDGLRWHLIVRAANDDDGAWYRGMPQNPPIVCARLLVNGPAKVSQAVYELLYGQRRHSLCQ